MEYFFVLLLTDGSVKIRDHAMTPKIVDKEAKRNQIIEAAVRVFAKMGFAKTRMLQIAEAAGMGKGTIYEYFRSKEDLFVNVFNAFIKQTEKQIADRIRKVDDPVEKLKTYFKAWREFLNDDFLEYGDLMIDIWAEGVRLHMGKDIFDLKGMYRRLRVQLIQILDEGIAQKKFKPLNTTLVASVFIAALDGLFLQWLLEREAFNVQEAIEEMGDVIIGGVMIET